MPEDHASVHPTLDASLRMVGTVMLLARSLDGRVRDSEDGLSIAELTVLAHVNRGNDLPSTIARILQLDPGRVTRITDRLVKLGYLERNGDDTDRRRSVLCATDTGRARLLRGRVDVSSAVNTLLGGLPDDERAALMHGLEGVRRLIDARPADD